MMKINLKNVLIIFLIMFLLIPCFHYFISENMDFVRYSSDNQGKYLQIQDYAYHIIVSKSFWFENSGNIYSLEFQQKALSNYINSKIDLAMPIGITPIGLLLFLPFSFLSLYSISLSYTFWMSFSFFVLFSAIWHAILEFEKQNRRFGRWTIFIIFTIFSFSTFTAIFLGQTSIYGVGLLVFLIVFIKRKNESLRSSENISYPIIIVMFFLGIKPNYTILGLGFLLIYGIWRESLYSIVIFIVFFIVLSPFLESNWFFSYLKTVKMINNGNLPEQYSWTYAPETMILFRTAFKGIIGDHVAVKISNIVNLSIYVFVMLFGTLVIKQKNDKKDFWLLRKVTKEQASISLIASYLLFAPYAGSYEDFLFLIVFYVVLIFGEIPKVKNWESIIISLLLLITLSHNLLDNGKSILFIWFLKLILFILIYRILESNKFYFNVVNLSRQKIA